MQSPSERAQAGVVRGGALTASLYRAAVSSLRERGDHVETSDLYSMGWKAVVDRADFPDEPDDAPLRVAAASRRAFGNGTLTGDVVGEIDKIRRADAIVFFFPMWWLGPPAILKGWFERVFVNGWAYGVTDPADPRRSIRYGEGPWTGKRALVVMTSGAGESAFGPRGISGELHELLFPLLHGLLFYVGATVLPPMNITEAHHLDDADIDDAHTRVRHAVATMDAAQPMRYRRQNGGDYDDDLVLRPEHAPGRHGLSVHHGE